MEKTYQNLCFFIIINKLSFYKKIKINNIIKDRERKKNRKVHRVNFNKLFLKQYGDGSRLL